MWSPPGLSSPSERACDGVTPSLRTQRLKLTWLLAIPFLWLARPTPPLLLVGFLIALPGLLLRAAAAGFIEKDRVLATSGPYARLRHPLYLGSFFLGMGLAVAGGRGVFLPFLIGFFALVYARTIKAEEETLARLFGEAYEEYRIRVPALVPRIRSGAEGGFDLRLFLRNREWEAGVGVLGGFALLWLKMEWLG